MKATTLSVSIAAPQEKVSAFVSNPKNLPQWAGTFFKSIENIDGEWTVQSPDGPVVVAFVEDNHFAVFDHTITLPSGVSLTNPMRVVPNGSGSEVMFTLFQTAEMSEQKFSADAKLVETDLDTLRRILGS